MTDTEFMAWLEVMSSHENLAGLMGQVSLGHCIEDKVFLICISSQ